VRIKFASTDIEDHGGEPVTVRPDHATEALGADPSPSLFPSLPVFVVDDEEHTLSMTRLILESEGITHVVACKDGNEAFDLVSRREPAAMLLDLDLPGVSGQEILEYASQAHPLAPVIVITSSNDPEKIVWCMKKGAHDYVVKPVDRTRLITTVRRALAVGDMLRENDRLTERVFDQQLKHPEVFSGIVTRSHAMLSIFRYIESIAASSHPVMIMGETGVGKELIARAIHDAGRRRGAFVATNVAGLDDNAFSDTLFGHKRGAFTGADRDRPGLIGKAAGGTLFLDEIGDLAPTSQVKLLRLLQEREYYPLGSDAVSHTDARVLVATNRTLEDLQKKDLFRSDLYYRLRSHQLVIPPLRDRRDDIPLLLDHFLAGAARELGRKPPTPSPDFLEALLAYSFPGNVREFQAILVDALSRHHSGKLAARHLGAIPGAEAPGAPPRPSAVTPAPARLATLQETEDRLIDEALALTNRNLSLAAVMLGTSRQTLHRKLNKRRL
jgi:two-component system, NtrC family, response regulator HydG